MPARATNSAIRRALRLELLDARSDRAIEVQAVCTDRTRERMACELFDEERVPGRFSRDARRIDEPLLRPEQPSCEGATFVETEPAELGRWSRMRSLPAAGARELRRSLRRSARRR